MTNRDTSVEITNMCMVYDGKGNVLVEEKVGKDYKGLIFPGGHVEEGESIVDSTIREIKEETGLDISNLELCGIKDWVGEKGNRFIVFLYKTNVFSGSIQSSSEGDIFWIPLEELKEQSCLWDLDKLLEIFLGNGVTELFYERCVEAVNPILK